MSIVNDEHRFIFLHVAKTGGRSINVSLKERLGERGSFYTAQIDPRVDVIGRKLGVEARDLVGRDRWNDYFTFAFVRNPYDRAVSIYEHLRTTFVSDQGKPRRLQSAKAHLLEKILSHLDREFESLTFADFVTGVIRDRVVENYHWDSQANAVTDESGDVMFDFLGRFENLQQDFEKCCGRIGIPTYQLPHHNRARRKDWKTYYTPALLEIVHQCYAEDFEILDYPS